MVHIETNTQEVISVTVLSVDLHPLINKTLIEQAWGRVSMLCTILKGNEINGALVYTCKNKTNKKTTAFLKSLVNEKS